MLEMNCFRPPLPRVTLIQAILARANLRRAPRGRKLLILFTALTLFTTALPSGFAQARPPELSDLPPGLLRKIQQDLPTRDQHLFGTRVSKGIRTQLSKFRHLSTERLKKEERNFHSLEQYTAALASGLYWIDSVKIKFKSPRSCLDFFYEMKKHRRTIKNLWFGKECSQVLVSRSPLLDSALLEWGQGLESLTLNLEYSSASDLDAFLSGFQFKKLRRLKLKFPNLLEFPVDLSQLAPLLKRIHSLEALSLSGHVSSGLFDALVAHKKKHLRSNLRLKSFSLKHSQFHASEVNGPIATFIAQQSATLETLSLALRRNHGELWGHREDMTRLISAIAEAKHLTRLNVQNLFSYDLSHSLDSLYRIKSLKDLRLRGYPLVEQDLLIFKQLLKNNSKIENLLVRSSFIQPESILTLQEELQSLQNLRRLDLSHNPLGSVGFYRVLDSLPADNVLEELTCESCRITNHYSSDVTHAPTAECAFSALSPKFSRIQILKLNHNSLFESPSFLRQCAGLFCYPPTPTLLSAFADAQLTHLSVVALSYEKRDLRYAFGFEMDQSRLNHLELWIQNGQDLIDTPFYQSYPIDPGQVRSLRISDMNASFLTNAKRFYAPFNNLESLELSWVRTEELVPIAKALPPGLRFVKFGQEANMDDLTLKTTAEVLRVKGILLYDFRDHFLNDG